MDKELLYLVRVELKKKLYRERAKFTKEGYMPLCAICGEPPHGVALEMHETFITRGDVQGNIELKYDIMSRYNCVLVHGDTNCHKLANTEKGKLACAKHILDHEGFHQIDSWLLCLQNRMLSDTATQARRLIKLLCIKE